MNETSKMRSSSLRVLLVDYFFVPCKFKLFVNTTVRVLQMKIKLWNLEYKRGIV